MDTTVNDTAVRGHALADFFRPRSIALVGATDRSAWSRQAHANVQSWGFEGALHLVNRRGGVVHGAPAVTSCAEIPGGADVALLMVPAQAIEEALDDAHRAGVRNAIILASGFGEAGPAGAARQAALAATAAERGMRILGPNTLGFINVTARAPVWTSRMSKPFLAGGVAIVSQSGAMGGYIGKLADQQGVGLSAVIATGNEVGIDVAAVLDYLAEDPETKVVAVFAESVRDPVRFAAAAEKAADRGKPIVILKVGVSEVTAKAAQAHTGAVIGDDRVFDAVCRKLGLIRVPSLEDLVVTAGLLARTGRIRRQSLGVISISGGAGEIVADRASEEGVPLASLSARTTAALGEILPEFGSAHNPFDITGAAILMPELFEKAVPVVAADPEVGLIACILDVPATDYEYNPTIVTALEHIGRGLETVDIPAVMLNMIAKPVSALTQEVAAKAKLPFVCGGLNQAVAAVGGAFRWSAWMDGRERREAAAPALAAPSVAGPAIAERLLSERETLAHLASRGVPVIPVTLAASAEEAGAAAERLGGKVALKVASPDIQHKSDIGGVVLNVQGDAGAQDAFRRIAAAVAAKAPGARMDGVLVAPMRQGLELFVGVTRDPQWGPLIAVGLGGVWVEALKDVSLRLLPVREAEVIEALSELRGAALLKGYRGSPPADLEAVARAVCAIGDAALELGDGLAALEVNPLLVEGDRVEALDALAVWDDEVGAPAKAGA